jgi:hypothetical protein
MNEIIYTATQLCPHCNQQITINLWSDDPKFLEKAPNLEGEAKTRGMHSHWFHNHRVCARCGELIEAGNGSWALASKVDWPINQTYIAWTHKNGLEVLEVHGACTEPSYQQTQ